MRPRSNTTSTAEPRMVTTRTRVGLVDAAMGKLMVVGSGQSPAAEDRRSSSATSMRCSSVHDDAICDVTSDPAIPAAWFDALASLLANVSAVDSASPTRRRQA